jgi:hypothetical protein
VAHRAVIPAAFRAGKPTHTTLLVRVETDEGLVGWGEGFGHYGMAPATRTALEQLVAPRAVGQDPLDEALGSRITDALVGGTNCAHQNHVEVSAAIKLSGIAAVVVESCESAFVRRALSQGLPVLVVPGISQAVADGDVIEVDPATGIVRTADGTVLRARPFSQRMVAIWQAGGLIPSLQKEARAREPAAATV